MPWVGPEFEQETNRAWTVTLHRVEQNRSGFSLWPSPSLVIDYKTDAAANRLGRIALNIFSDGLK